MVGVLLMNVATGVAIVDGLEYAMRWNIIPQMYLSHVIMVTLIGMCVVNIIGASLDRSDR